MYHVYFLFSEGLSRPIIVAPGFLEKALAHVAEIEEGLRLEKAPRRWDMRVLEGADDKPLCALADKHNDWVRWVYGRFEHWAENPPDNGEELTPEQASRFWHALQMIDVPPRKWTKDYFIGRMKHLFDVMTGNESEGVTFDSDMPLTREQAGAVITLLGDYLDRWDTRLTVPKGRKFLVESDEYTWCGKCGCAWYEDDWAVCDKQGCEIKAEFGE